MLTPPTHQSLPPCNDHADSPEQVSRINFPERQIIGQFVEKIDGFLQASFGVDWQKTASYNLKKAEPSIQVPDDYRRNDKSVLSNAKVLGEIVRIFREDKGWKVKEEGGVLTFSNPPEGYLQDNARVRQRTMSAISELNDSLRAHFGRDGNSSVKLPLPNSVDSHRILKLVVEGFEKKGWQVSPSPQRNYRKTGLIFEPK